MGTKLKPCAMGRGLEGFGCSPEASSVGLMCMAGYRGGEGAPQIGGILRARRDKDLKGAERMERKTGGIRPPCHRQAKAAGGGKPEKEAQLVTQG